jgi:CBS domain-containing protein
MTNIAFFLVPKKEVISVKVSSTLRQTLERMEHHRYTAVPIVTEVGKYIGTVTEGDLLWYMKNNVNVTFDNAHHYPLEGIPLRMNIQPVRIDATVEDLLRLVTSQNFVPVIDDKDTFIGIVRRSDIMEYCNRQLFEPKPAT